MERKNKADMYREFGFVYSTIQTYQKNRTKITGAFEGN